MKITTCEVIKGYSPTIEGTICLAIRILFGDVAVASFTGPMLLLRLEGIGGFFNCGPHGRDELLTTRFSTG